MMTDRWRERVEAVCGQHMSPQAAATAGALLSAFHTAEQLAMGRTDEYLRGAAVRMLTDLTFGLGLDAWFNQHRGFLMPVFSVAMLAWLDAHEYAAQATPVQGDVARFKSVLTRGVIGEVAIACLVCDKGPAAARQSTRKLRDDLMQITE